MKKVGVILAIVLMVAILIPSTAIAEYLPPSHVYLDQDPDKQKQPEDCTSGCSYLENYTLWDWKDWWGDHVLNWYCNPDPTYHACVQQAITNWSNAFPTLQWVETFDQNAANVKFLLAGTGTPAYVYIHGFYDDPYQVASFWIKAEVVIDPVNFVWVDVDTITGAVAHEIGHLYGLHEQSLLWDENDGNPPNGWWNACNPDVVSIMDTCLTPVWNQQQQKWQILGSCDNLSGPAQQDINNVTAYWGQGTVSDLTAYAWSFPPYYMPPYFLTVSFKDQGWAECHAILMYYHWNGNQWVYYEGLCYNPNMGLHKDYPNGLGDFFITRTNLPASFGASGYNYCKVGLYFRGLDCGGGWVNSPIVFVP